MYEVQNLTIVMYHYVRPIADSDFPGIKGLDLKGFQRQLDYLVEHYSNVTTEHVIDACLGGRKLPDNACWLTFDDGYKDHFKYVLPELLNRQLHGAFFPPRVAIEQDQVLDVNLIHHILSCANDVKLLVSRLNDHCLGCGISEGDISAYYEACAVPNRFDDADTIYVKRMLQHVLPENVRHSITSSLFKMYVGVSESDFARKLYMSLDEVRQLVKSGMYVGSHGSMHYWLDKLPIERQEKDIIESLSFLESVGASTKDWVMCYPYGAYNDDTLTILNKHGAAVGITTLARKAIISVDNTLTLPRLDTNDFPQ